MAVFEYKAIDKNGKNARGVIDADSPVAARRKLREQNLHPVQVTESSSKTVIASSGSNDANAPKKGGFGRVGVRDIALTTRQFAVLLHAGMPLVESLNALIDQTPRPRLKRAIFDIRDRVNSGTTLGDAMAMHPKIFSNLYVNMVRAGETSGSLEAVLFRLADILEHNAKTRAKIMSTLAYPIFMALFAVGVISFLMLVIVPRITLIFQKQKAELPGITKFMIGMSNFIGNYWFVILGVAFGGFFLWRLWISRPAGRLRWDRMRLRFPLYGQLQLKLISARFARTLGTMLESGLTMMRALDVVTSVLGNKHIEEAMGEVRAGVRRGKDLALPLKEAGIFPPMLINMIELGQRSGEIEGMLIKVADTYDDDVRLTVEALVGLMEPLIIICMGLFVGFLVLAILLPILNMSRNV